MSKITMAAAGAIGYLLGSRAGREKYDRLTEKAESLWNNPKVQQGTRRAKQKAAEVADDKGLDVDNNTLNGDDNSFDAGQGQHRDQFDV